MFGSGLLPVDLGETFERRPARAVRAEIAALRRQANSARVAGDETTAMRLALEAQRLRAELINRGTA